MTEAVAFDFDRKCITALPLGGVPDACAGGHYCWIDFDDLDSAAAALPGLGIAAGVVARVDIDNLQAQVRLDRSCIHCVFVETALAGVELQQSVLHVFLAQNFIATAHARPSSLVENMRQTFEDDFHAAAETGGFLLFEIADHLIGGYRETLAELSLRVDAVQQRLLGDGGDGVLADVSELTRALLEFRNAVVSARETIDELATRRSTFVQASTRPFLERQTVPLDRIANDAATERSVLSEGLGLYMGIVSHRTNRLVQRLTVVSMIFLPLNFFAAVYGMNFATMPELGWRYGYAAFWVFVLLLVGMLLTILRRQRWF